MNNGNPTQTAELCFRRAVADLKNFAHREPGQAVVAAVGVGRLINLLPTRLIAGTAAIVGAVLVRPILLSLGATKVMEICCQNTSPQQSS
ncbi:hypothetical protein [Prosthecobacter sp.]|uniref:hypothetical protein n=1 Tax=Prosthecobacter sp. TaxID=1965333 RepID=UPI0024875D67|nr:hypothetical protein [Prosthecobacter sp.]MDI1311082.1 hypothetical protein [Prosthecobacter sp.]